jgi:hypothetical protein
MSRINLPILIIIWWIGAIAAASSLLIPIYGQYVIVGTSGWLVVIMSTGFIIYEIKRTKEEDKRNLRSREK